jgi:hypothetical protein
VPVPLKLTHALAEYEGAEPDAVDSAGSPVQLVNTPLAGVPKAGVTNAKFVDEATLTALVIIYP